MSVSIAFNSTRYNTTNLSKDIDILEKIYSEELPKGSFLVEVDLISEKKIQQINLEHRNINKATDVLSFPLFSSDNLSHIFKSDVQYLLGNIFISPTVAKRHNETILDLIHHGMLHLLGFDHENIPSDWLEKEHYFLQKYHNQKINIKGIVNE